MKIRLSIVLLFTLILPVVFYSCGNNEPEKIQEIPSSDNPQSDSSDIVEDENFEYIYPELDCKEEIFTFLNIEPVWNFRTEIVMAEMTGEILDDAIFMRNIAVEDKFNVRFAEVTATWDTIHNKIKNTVLSGDDIYQVMYCPGYGSVPVGSLVTQKFFYDFRI